MVLVQQLQPPSKNFPQHVLDSPYQPFTALCLASSSSQALVFSSHKGILLITVNPFPSQAIHPDLVQLQAKQLPLENCTFLEGSQPSLQKLCNPLWHPVGLQDFAILPANTPSSICTNFPNRVAQPRICTNLGSSQLLYPEIAQSSQVVILDPNQECAFFPSSCATACMNNLVDQFYSGPRKLELHACMTCSSRNSKRQYAKFIS